MPHLEPGFGFKIRCIRVFPSSGACSLDLPGWGGRRHRPARLQQHLGPTPGLGQFLRRTLDLCRSTRSVWTATNPPCPPSPARALSHARRSMNTARRAPLPALTSEHRHQLYFPNTHGTATDMHCSHPRGCTGWGQFLRQLRELEFSSSPGRFVPLASSPRAAAVGPVLPAVGRRFSCQQRERALLCQDVPLPHRCAKEGARAVSVPPGRATALQHGGHAHPFCLRGSRGLLGPDADGEALRERQTQGVSFLPWSRAPPSPSQAALAVGFNCRASKDAEGASTTCPVRQPQPRADPCPPQPTQEPWDCPSFS